MNDINKNPYFNPGIQQEFKQYPAEQVVSTPSDTVVLGFTSIIMPVYFVNYAVFHYTGNAIGSIREHTSHDKTPYEIILVINGRTGIELPDLRLSYVDKVIQNEENKGYAFAVNQGIRIARGEYIAILNNDIQVFDFWLDDMQEALTKLDLVMAKPMYGMPFARATESWDLRKMEANKPLEETFTDFVDFSCVLTRKSLFEEIGTFNEDFFMYGEDLDILRRIKGENKKYASSKKVNIHHIIGATSSGINETPEIMNKSKEKLKEIWGF